MIACSKWVLLIDINYVCVISLICLLNFQIRWWVCTCVSIGGIRSNLFLLSFPCMMHCQHQKVCSFFCWYGYMDQRYPLLFLFACSIVNISGYVSYLTYVEICWSCFWSLHCQLTYIIAGELYYHAMWMWPMFSLFLCWNFTPLPTVGGEFTEWFVACTVWMHDQR